MNVLLNSKAMLIIVSLCRESRGSIHSMKACSNISASLIRSNNPIEKITAIHYNMHNYSNSDSESVDAISNRQNASSTLVTCPLDNCAFSSCSLNGGMFDIKNLQPILLERYVRIILTIISIIKRL